MKKLLILCTVLCLSIGVSSQTNIDDEDIETVMATDVLLMKHKKTNEKYLMISNDEVMIVVMNTEETAMLSVFIDEAPSSDTVFVDFSEYVSHYVRNRGGLTYYKVDENEQIEMTITPFHYLSLSEDKKKEFSKDYEQIVQMLIFVEMIIQAHLLDGPFIQKSYGPRRQE